MANVADEIAYNHQDIDDGLWANLLTVEQMLEFPLFRALYGEALRRRPKSGEKPVHHGVIREKLNCLVVDLITAA